MKRTSIFTAILLAIATAGCSQYALVDTSTYNNADLASYKTFRIVTPDDENRLPPGMEEITYYNIAQAVREQMVERGYTESPESPLLINLGVTVKREVATEPLAATLPTLPPPPTAPLPGPHFFFGPRGPGYGGPAPWFIYPRSYYWNPNTQVVTGIYREGVLTMDIVNTATKTPLYSSSVATILDNGDSQFRNLKGIAEAVGKLFSRFPVPLLPQYRGH
ncbi:MAG: DUF4136 domain-containing protein [Clostridium sp.]|nr:DUF4136 domain-containing protein [Clostridium sp.]